MTKLPDDDLKRSKRVGVVLSVLKRFKWKLYRCICWLIVEVILRNARCNDEIPLIAFNSWAIFKMQHSTLNGFPNISICLIHASWTFVLLSEVTTLPGMFQLRPLLWNRSFCCFNLFIRITSQPWWKGKCNVMDKPQAFICILLFVVVGTLLN